MTHSEQNEIFEAWLAAHLPIFHHAVNAFAQGDDRKDLMQEVLLAVWKAIPHFRAASQVSTFLYRVSHNTAITWRKRKAHTARVEAESVHTSQLAATQTATNNDRARLDLLYQKIALLPPLDRSLLLLSLDELPYREIAEIHGISENLVGVRLLRARTRLAQAMQEPETPSPK